MGAVVLGAVWAARPSPSAAGQAPPITLEPNLTIGVEDGDEKLMFGRIVRVDVDGRGHIYVLDFRFRRISVFDNNGSLLRQISVPEGQGPGGDEPRRNSRDPRRNALCQRYAESDRLWTGR
ncbi:MAG: hypothetical protein MZW92_02195 [Comamonadaceae bacterium]|nr:hypothetical protein [Comamonadaceae bacterium]